MPRVKPIHPLQWVYDSLSDRPDFFQRKMFGCEAAYLGDRLVLVLAAGEEPWNGLLVCTSREEHPSLMAEFPSLKAHEVLGKWLYVSQQDAEFETLATEIVETVQKGDSRIGVAPKPRRRRPSTKGRG